MEYIIENELLGIKVNSKGAELLSIIDKSSIYEYLWQGDSTFWDNRSPVLFPIVGNLNNGSYSFEEKDYSMQRHGFAKDMNFRVVKITKDSIVFSLGHDFSTLMQYPFEFLLTITYKLSNRILTITYEVENTGVKTMFFSIGGHPGFNCSIKPEGVKNCILTFNKKETITHLINELGYLTGKEKPFLVEEADVDLGSIDFDRKTKVYILQNLNSNEVMLQDGKSGRRVHMGFDGFPFLGIWSPSNDAPFVCIEPWYGVTATIGVEDVLNEKFGIQTLEKGKSFICNYRVLFE